jgi:hypothetical protein
MDESTAMTFVVATLPRIAPFGQTASWVRKVYGSHVERVVARQREKLAKEACK